MNSVVLRVGCLRTVIRLAEFFILPFCAAQAVQWVFSHWIASFTQASEEDEDEEANTDAIATHQQGQSRRSKTARASKAVFKARVMSIL
jgi:hypothetical protein